MLLTKLLCYAYRRGVVTVDQHPNFRTISDFRERRLGALGTLFEQTVRLAGRLGQGPAGRPLEHVAQDGTKILANASKHRAMSDTRLQQAETRLSAEIGALLAAAQTADAQEDAQDGPERTGDELPVALAGEVARRERRLATIRAAKAALEQEAKAAAEAAPNGPCVRAA